MLLESNYYHLSPDHILDRHENPNYTPPDYPLHWTDDIWESIFNTHEKKLAQIKKGNEELALRKRQEIQDITTNNALAEKQHKDAKKRETQARTKLQIAMRKKNPVELMSIYHEYPDIFFSNPGKKVLLGQLAIAQSLLKKSSPKHDKTIRDFIDFCKGLLRTKFNDVQNNHYYQLILKIIGNFAFSRNQFFPS